MRPEDVPADLLDLAHEARLKAIAQGNGSLRPMLAAVLPAHEWQIRERVADEIEQEEADHGDGSSWDGGMARAAEIARGETR